MPSPHMGSALLPVEWRERPWARSVRTQMWWVCRTRVAGNVCLPVKFEVQHRAGIAPVEIACEAVGFQVQVERHAVDSKPK